MFLQAFQQFLPGLVKFRFVQREFLANAAQFRQILVGVTPQLFCDGKLLACGDRIALVFGHRTKGVVAAGVARVLLDHFPRSEFSQSPFLGLASPARD